MCDLELNQQPHVRKRVIGSAVFVDAELLYIDYRVSIAVTSLNRDTLQTS
jgi:hypothetical protein